MEDTSLNETDTTGKTRLLAAIMFADMTGYTALMQEDEQRAKVLRDRQRHTLQTLIPLHHGKIIQYYGDGSLSIFDSAINAVNAAVEIQQDLLTEPRVSLRIGIHSGDIVYDHEGVYGDSVNVASRIEALSVPGAVLISDKIFDEVKNQSDISTKFLGRFTLKNVKRPVDIYALEKEGLIIPTPAQVGVKAGSEKTIAVLPFVNMSSNPDNEYFSDGISEEILNALTHIEGLQVTARTSSFFFKGKNQDVREVGAKLGVSHILEGSVRTAGKRVRITAQLINTADGYHVWSEVYDSDLEDIFQVQDEISLKILNKLKENFSESPKKEAIVKAPTENLDAYNCYLKGKYHWNKSNPEDIAKAIKSFNEAIDLDPKFAAPYCDLSYCYTFLGSAGLMQLTEAYPKARDLTLKAIELDPENAEAHLSLASIKFFHNWDFDGAEKSLNKAESLGLNSSLLNQVHGWFLIALGDFDKAIQKMQQALILDPLSLPLRGNLADAFAFAGKFEEALEQYDKAIEMDPTFRRGFEGKGMVYLACEEYDKAIENLEQYQKMIGHPLKGVSSLGHAYAMAGQKEKAYACLEKLKQREKEEPDKLFYMDYAFLYAGLKEHDKAFFYLNKTYEHRIGMACLGMIFCIRYPMLNQLRSDLRFKELTNKMKLEA